MLNPCTAAQWVVVELCEEIGIDIVGIANYEFFSSMFKDFSIYGSNKYIVCLYFANPQRYPPQWTLLSNFTAKNVREIQYFKLPQHAWYKYDYYIIAKLILKRYIKIEFHSHYGSEFYCPISVLRVHGSTLVEELKERT
jgi:hypothetical protein